MKTRYTLPRSILTLLCGIWATCFMTVESHGQSNVNQSIPSVKAGFTERDISPSIGMEQPGGYGKSFHKTYHDSCKVRVAVFDDGKSCMALVGIDSLVVPRQVVLEARRQVQLRCGIPETSVLLNASHSHSSGPVGMVLPGEYEGASDLVRKLAYEESSCADPLYLKQVTDAIVDGVTEAYERRQPVVLSFGYGHEEKVSFNRRLRMKNGQSWSHPGSGNPDILEYAGPIDPQVGVIGAWDSQGRLKGVVVNFACHATTNPGGISANWIYHLEKTIQGGLDSQAHVIFLQGACGDVTQVDNLSVSQRPKAEEWSQLVGTCVGAEAIKVLLLAPKVSAAAIDVRQEVLSIKRRPPSAERVAKSLAIVSQPKSMSDPSDWLFAKEIVMLDYLNRTTPMVDVEVQCIKLGPCCFVTNPSEYFVKYGLDIKKGSHHPFTFPCELSNGSVGYVPTEEAFGSEGGGYETRLTSYSNLEVSAGRRIAEKGIQLANEMGAETSPSRPKGPPFVGKPWSYGNVAPELE